MLDLHIKYLESSSHEHLGSWLARRWKKCLHAQAKATVAVEQCGVSQDVLRAQWSLQASAQTRPAARMSSIISSYLL